MTNKRIAFISGFVFVCLFLFTGSRKEGKETSIESVLRIAGNNKPVIKNILSHYDPKKEELKYKATIFLLENMVDQYHFEGSGINRYRLLFDTIEAMSNRGEAVYNRSWDSLQKTYNFSADQSLIEVNDLQSIKEKPFIENIESAFAAWQYPWARNLPFEDFCEYILPCKLLKEKPDDWRTQVQKRYSWISDSVKKPYNVKDVCLLLNRDLKQFFYVNARVRCNWSLNYKDLLKLRTGTCLHAAQLSSYTMRGMGLPVVIDFTPFWGNKNIGHDWSALLVDGKPLHFVGSESDPGKDKIEFTRSYWLRRKRAKVFRKTFAIQKNTPAYLADSLYLVPEVFRTTHIKDVTSQYVPVADVSLWLNNEVKDQDYAYLCVYNNNDWQPIYWGKVGFFGRTQFKNMGRDILYLPMYYKDDKFIPAQDPFVLDGNGKTNFIKIDKDRKQNLVVYKKYPEDKSNLIFKGETYELLYWNDKWVSFGKQVAASDSLVFKNVPSGALYWVRNLDKGIQERIFTYKNGKQVWW